MERQNQFHVPQPEQHTGGTTFFKTCFNGLNTLSGVGILSMPYAISQGGWLCLILLCFLAMLNLYTGLLLHKCMDKHPSIKTYPDIGEAAFGYKGRAVIAIFLYLELFFIATEFLILEGDNLEKLFPNMNIKLTGLSIRGKQGFILLTGLAVLPTTWVSLGFVAYISVGGIAASVILVCCVLWAGSASDGVGFHQRGQLMNLAGMPNALSLFAFCFGGHAVFPMLRTSMRSPSQFPKVLLVCFIASTISYGSMAILGYLMYGEHLTSQITLNLPTKKISTSIAIYTTVINPFTKYAILVAPIAAAIENTSFCKSKPASIFTRTGIVSCTVLVARFVPFFGYVMEFIGAFLIVTISLLLPCLCYLKINAAARRFGFELIIIISILLTGSYIPRIERHCRTSSEVMTDLHNIKLHGYR